MLYRELNFSFLLLIFGNMSTLIVRLVASNDEINDLVLFLLISVINLVCFFSINFKIKLIDAVSEDIKLEESHYTRALTSVPYRSIRFLLFVTCLSLAVAQLVQLD